MPAPYCTYYTEGLLRQNSAPEARRYLGIDPSPLPPIPVPPLPSQDWPQLVCKGSDQSVTNNDVPQNDTELFLPAAANAFYNVELLLLYSGNSAQGDYLGAFELPDLTGAGSAMGVFNAFNFNLQPVITPVQQGTSTKWPSDGAVLGVTGTITDMLCAQLRFLIRTVLAGNIQYQFCNASAGADRTSITRAGSTLRMQRLA